MSITGKNLIGGLESAQNDQSFQAVNPATGESLPTRFYEATREEIGRAIEKADAAFLPYREKTPAARAAFLEAIAGQILALGEELLERCHLETALPLARLTGERGRTVNQLKLFAEVLREGSWVEARIDTALPEREPLPRPDLRQMKVPLGPVGIFGASNFPLAFSVAGGDTASALAAGCPIVVKAHPLHPGTSELVGKAIVRAAQMTDMPEGVFSLVQGPSVDVGMSIVQHPAICAIGFTGSFKGGKALFDAAQGRPVPIPVFAEMGSTNPVFLLPGAIKGEQGQRHARGLAGSLTLGVGQFCTNPGLLITDSSDPARQWVDLLAREVQQHPPGTLLGSGIKDRYQVGIDRLRSKNGVDQLAESAASEGFAGVSSHLLRTDSSVFLNDPELAEEVFGPSSLVVQSAGKEELLKIASSLEGHLTASILGTAEDLQAHAELIRILERKVGRLIFNGYPTGVEVSHAMVHGGPFPATTAPQTTSVGTLAIRRFARPVCYQGFPEEALPAALRDANPLGIWRLVNGSWTQGTISD